MRSPIKYVALVACVTVARLAPAADDPRGLAAARTFAENLRQQEEADLAVFRVELAKGVDAKLWTDEDRRLAEEDLDQGLARMRKPPDLLTKPFYTEASVLRATTPVEAWIRLRMTQTKSLLATQRVVEAWQTAAFAEEAWNRAHSVQELAQPLAALQELKTRDPIRWANVGRAYAQSGSVGAASPIDPNRSARIRDSFAEPFDAWTVLASDDGLLPPNPEEDLVRYLRWRDDWQKLDSVGHRFVRRIGPAQRFLQAEEQYRRVLASLERKVVALIERSAPSSELAAALKPVISVPTVLAGERLVLPPGPPRAGMGPGPGFGQNQGMVTSYRDILEFVRKKNPPGLVQIPNDLPLTGYKAILRLCVAMESGDQRAAESARVALNAATDAMDHDLAAAVTEHLLPRHPSSPVPATTPPDSGRVQAQQLLDPSSYDSDAVRSAVTAILQDGATLRTREKSSRARIITIAGNLPAMPDPPLATVWEAAMNVTIERRSVDSAAQLLDEANRFPLLSGQELARWRTVVSALRTMITPGADRALLRAACYRVLEVDQSPPATKLAIEQLKAAR